jgi:pyruvate ferredoxin oxidoreductase beta subunit
MSAQAIKFYQVGSLAVGNRLLDPALRSTQADPDRANALSSGHRACQGCGEARGTCWTRRCAPPAGTSSW